jgi:pilus assembly protein CpaC
MIRLFVPINFWRAFTAFLLSATLSFASLHACAASSDSVAARVEARVEAPGHAGSPTSQGVPGEVLYLYVGQTFVLNEANVRRIAVGNGKVLQATTLDEKQVLIIPETAGQTTVHLWGKNGGERHYVPIVF